MPVNSMYVYTSPEVPSSNKIRSPSPQGVGLQVGNRSAELSFQLGTFCTLSRKYMPAERFGPPGQGTVAPGDTRISEEIRDDVLLRRAAKGEEDPFTTLYRR